MLIHGVKVLTGIGDMKTGVIGKVMKMKTGMSQPSQESRRRRDLRWMETMTWAGRRRDRQVLLINPSEEGNNLLATLQGDHDQQGHLCNLLELPSLNRRAATQPRRAERGGNLMAHRRGTSFHQWAMVDDQWLIIYIIQ